MEWIDRQIKVAFLKSPSLYIIYNTTLALSTEEKLQMLVKLVPQGHHEINIPICTEIMHNLQYSPSDEDSREKNQERMASTVCRARQLVKEANTLADTLQIDREFKAALALSTHLLSPRRSADVIMGNEVMIRALRRKKGTDSICSIEELENTILPSMRSIHERCKSGETIQVRLLCKL